MGTARVSVPQLLQFLRIHSPLSVPVRLGAAEKKTFLSVSVLLLAFRLREPRVIVPVDRLTFIVAAGLKKAQGEIT